MEPAPLTGAPDRTADAPVPEMTGTSVAWCRTGWRAVRRAPARASRPARLPRGRSHCDGRRGRRKRPSTAPAIVGRT